MTIPRGYIPGKTDFSVITSSTGSISFDDDNLQTSGTIACNSLISPDIKALIAYYGYQYVYDWSVLPENSDFKFVKYSSGSPTTSVSDGTLTLTTNAVSDRIFYHREAGLINPGDTILVQHKFNISSSVNHLCVVAHIAENEDQGGSTYKNLIIAASTTSLYIVGSGGSSTTLIYSDDFTSDKTLTIIKDKSNYSYIYMDGVLIYTIADSSLALTGSAIGSSYSFGFGVNFLPYDNTGGSTATFNSKYFKYSICREGSKEQNGTSSKIVGGNIDVQNQAETLGIQIQSDKILSTGTNQDLTLEANGTGEIICNSDISGKAFEGVSQYRFSGTSKSTTTVNLSIDEGYVVINSSSNNVTATLPSIDVADIGKRIRIRNWSSSNTTTIQRNDSDVIFDKDNVSSLFTSIDMANGNDWVELVVDWTTYWQVVDKTSGVTLS